MIGLADPHSISSMKTIKRTCQSTISMDGIDIEMEGKGLYRSRTNWVDGEFRLEYEPEDTRISIEPLTLEMLGRKES